MNKRRIFTIVGGVFGLVGVVLLGIGIAVAASTAIFMTSAERTEGRVVALISRIDIDDEFDRDRDRRFDRDDDLDEYWYPTVEFTVDGRQYSFESSVGSNPPAYQEGQTVPVAYDPDSPSDARIASFGQAFFVPSILGVLGIVFTPIGAVLLVKARRITAQRDWLQKHGQEVWATPHVDIEYSVKINHRHPYVVRATWQDESRGRMYTTTSDYIRHDPGPSLQGRTHVRVLYDPDNPDCNMLDLG